MSLLDTFEFLANKARNKDKIFDPSAINDELASKTDWNPMGSTSANFVSHKLNQESWFVLRYNPSIQSYIIVLFFSILVAFIPAVVMLVLIGKLFKVTLLGFGLIYVSIVFAGLFSTRLIVKPKIFDKREGWYYVGKNNCRKDNVPNPKQCRLDSVYAIQLVSKWVSSSSRNMTSHYCQMNLVLNDTSRIHVLTIKSLSTVRRDADIIAKFLGIPVWDGI